MAATNQNNSNFQQRAPNPDARDPYFDLTKSPGTQTQDLDDAPFWGDSPKTWDTVTLGDITLPGVAKVTGKIAMRKDRKRVGGKNGATITHLAYDPSPVSITLQLWTKDHWLSFKVLAGLIRPRRTAPVAFDIQHPATAVYGIASVEIIDAGFPQQQGDSDIYAVEIKALEYFPPGAPKAAVKTNDSSQGGNLLDDKEEAARGGAFSQRRPSDTKPDPHVNADGNGSQP